MEQKHNYIDSSYWDYLASPRSIFIEITNICNLNCSICANIQDRKNKGVNTLSKNSFVDYISKLPIKPKKIIITGGEPFINPDLYRILLYLESNAIYFTVYTNGFLTISNEFLAFLSNSKYLTNISVSLHSHLQVEHEKITNQPGSFKNTCTNIGLLTNQHIPVITNTVITEETPSDINRIINLSRQLGSHLAGFTKFIRHNEYCTSSLHPPTAKRMKEIAKIINIKNLSNRVDIDCSPYCEVGHFSEACFAGRTFCSINSFGEIRPCIFSNFSFGNINEQTFHAIWESDSTLQWRNNCSYICKSCDSFAECLGGCRCTQVKINVQDDKLNSTKSVNTNIYELCFYENLRASPLFEIENGRNGLF
ncbi:hypothetical protein LCGC14_2883190, partial [marine sediment metagenome]